MNTNINEFCEDNYKLVSSVFHKFTNNMPTDVYNRTKDELYSICNAALYESAKTYLDNHEIRDNYAFSTIYYKHAYHRMIRAMRALDRIAKYETYYEDAIDRREGEEAGETLEEKIRIKYKPKDTTQFLSQYNRNDISIAADKIFLNQLISRAHLPEHWLEVLRERYRDDEDISVIAERRGVTKQAVSQIIINARNKLRRVYDDDARKEEKNGRT